MSTGMVIIGSLPDGRNQNFYWSSFRVGLSGGPILALDTRVGNLIDNQGLGYLEIWYKFPLAFTLEMYEFENLEQVVPSITTTIYTGAAVANWTKAILSPTGGIVEAPACYNLKLALTNDDGAAAGTGSVFMRGRPNA